MIGSFYFVAIACFLQFCIAGVPANPGPKQWCTYGCDQACSYNTWTGSPNASNGYYLAGCQNFFQVSSFWSCSRKYCSTEEQAAGYDWKQAYCLFYAGIDVLSPSIISNLSDEDINNLPVLEFGGLSTVNTTSLPDQSTYDVAYRTGSEYYRQIIYHISYSNAMFIFWGIVIGLGVAYNMLYHLGLSAPEPIAKLWIRARGFFITTPFTVLQGDGSSAPLFESMASVIFVVINIIFCAVNYTAFDGNIFWPTIELQTLRYLADRMGYMAYANLAIFWLFGIRNNLLIGMTGWPFATFTRFHRAVAFVCTVQAIVHGAAYSYSAYLDGGNVEYIADFTEQYWVCGVTAVVTMSFAIIVSIPWIRLRWYDFFLVAHIILATVTLAMLYYHTAIFSGQFDGYIWSCVAFWAFDRMIRIGRVLYNVIDAQNTRCLIEYDQDSDIVRVDITNALGGLGKDVIGGYYYIYLLYTLKAWESHPFTVTRWRDAAPADNTTSLWHYSLIIRPYDGFTKKLAHQSLRGPVNRRMLLEGPYGAIPSPYNHITQAGQHNISEVMYIIGGSGISLAISSLYALLSKCAPSTGSGRMNIKLIWAVQKRAFLESVLLRELRAARSDIEIEAHITRDTVETTLATHVNYHSETKEIATEIVRESRESSHSMRSGPQLKVSYGRPRVNEYVLNAAMESKGVVGIVACGPIQMMKDVRAGVVLANCYGIERCRIFTEDFAW